MRLVATGRCGMGLDTRRGLGRVRPDLVWEHHAWWRPRPHFATPEWQRQSAAHGGRAADRTGPWPGAVHDGAFRASRRCETPAIATARQSRRGPVPAVSFLVSTLATQGDDRVHSGRAPRRNVARQKYNDHEDHGHGYKHFRIKRSHSEEQT